MRAGAVAGPMWCAESSAPGHLDRVKRDPCGAAGEIRMPARPA